MKKLITAIIAVALALTMMAGLVACEDDDAVVDFKIVGVQGVSGIRIDGTTVSFVVQNSIDEFPLTRIEFQASSSVDYDAYSDSALTKKYDGDSVPLNEGNNTFYVKGWFADKPEVTATFTFNIKRIASDAEIQEISIDESTFRKTYVLNEKLSPFVVNVKWDNGESASIEVDETMVSGFDTSTVGVKTIAIRIDSASITREIVVSHPESDSDITIGAWQSAYFVGDEPYLDGAYLVYDGREIQITEDMLSGFSTAKAGVVNVKITYGGSTVIAPIEVVSADGTISGEVTETVVNADALVDEVMRILERYNVKRESIENGAGYVATVLGKAGISIEQVKGLVDVVLEDDAPILTAADKLIDLINAGDEVSDPSEVRDEYTAFADAVSSVETMTSLLNCMDYVTEELEPAMLPAIVKAIMALAAPENYGSDTSDFEFYISNAYSYVYSLVDQYLSYDEAREMFDKNDLADTFDDYFAPDSDKPSLRDKIFELLGSDEALYISQAIISAFNNVADSDAQALADVVAFAVDTTETILFGELTDFDDLNEDISFYDAAKHLNAIGKVMQSANEALMADPAFVYSASVVVSEILNMTLSSSDLGGVDVGAFASAGAAVERAIVDLIATIDGKTLTDIYLNVSAMIFELSNNDVDSPEYDATSLGKTVSLGASLIYPYYTEFDLKEKQSVGKILDWISNMSGSDLSSLIDIVAEGAALQSDVSAKNADFAEYGKTFLAALGILPSYDDTDATLSVDQYGTVFVPVGASKQAVVSEIDLMSSITLYYGDYGYMRISDFATGVYGVDYDASKEGFFSAVIEIDGASSVVECYAYDDTTAGKLISVYGRSRINFFALDGSAPTLDFYDLPYQFIHSESGKMLDFYRYNYVHYNNGFAVGLDDTNGDDSVIYGTLAHVDHEILGEVTFPALYMNVAEQPEITDTVYTGDIVKVLQDASQDDLLNEIDNYGNVKVTYDDIMSESFFIYDFINMLSDYSYGYENVSFSGYAPQTPGKQDVTVTVTQTDTNKQYSFVVPVEVMTSEQAITVVDYYAYPHTSVLPVGADKQALKLFITLYTYDGNYYEIYSYEDLEYYAEELDFDIELTGFDSSKATDGTATYTLTIGQFGKQVLTTTGYYSIYDPAAEPVPLQFDYYRIPTITESELQNFGSFLERIGAMFALTDGSYWAAGQDISAIEDALTYSYELSYSSEFFDVYNVSITGRYISFSRTIKVIDDALAEIPTALYVNLDHDHVWGSDDWHSINHWKCVPYGYKLTPQDFEVNVVFGYGYKTVELDMSAIGNDIEIQADTSKAGPCRVTITYKKNLVSVVYGVYVHSK